MKQPPLPLNEEERLQALHDYRVLDTSPEQAFDDIVLLASHVWHTPIALVSLVDTDRQWFKARVGLDISETPRDVAFCPYTILDDHVLVVADALRDERFAHNPLVTGEPHIRFYAGAPLITPGGHRLGTLCVIDRVPREADKKAVEVLEALGRRVVAELELRRASVKLADALDRVRVLSGLVPMCAYCRRVRDDKEFWHRVEAYLHDQAGAEVTHGICPDCRRDHYPDSVTKTQS